MPERRSPVGCSHALRDGVDDELEQPHGGERQESRDDGHEGAGDGPAGRDFPDELAGPGPVGPGLGFSVCGLQRPNGTLRARTFSLDTIDKTRFGIAGVEYSQVRRRSICCTRWLHLPLSSQLQLDLLHTAMEQGLSLRVCVHGVSMAPLIRDGDVVTIAPLAGGEPRVGEVVACVLPDRERLVLHRVVESRGQGWLVQGDNVAVNDGVVGTDAVLGRVVSVERDGRQVAFGSGRAAPGVAWLSRTGALRALGLPRRAFYHAASGLRRRLQGAAVYRSLGRRLGGRIGIDEASEADMRMALDLVGRTEAGLLTSRSPDRQ